MPGERIPGMGKLSDFFGEDGPAKRLWDSVKIGVPLWIAGAVLTVYWLIHVPPPGYSIGALAVVAGIMSVRDIKVLGKISWVVLLVCLLLTEFRAIDKDRAENQDQQKNFFEAQKKGFSEITAQQKTDFDLTAGGLKVAIDGLNRTLNQTHPYATVHFDKLEFAGSPPPIMGPDIPMSFNFYYTDTGAETATKVRLLGKIYVGKPDDKEAQSQLIKKFESDWKSGGEIVTTHVDLVPAYPSASTIKRSLTEVEAKQLSQFGTLFFFVRFEYTDSMGRWRTDACTSFQREEPSKMDYNIFHTCTAFNKFRYAVHSSNSR